MGKTATAGGRLAYADLLRAVAMLAVIVVHLAGSRLGSVPVGSAEFHVLNAYDGLAHWCVPVFIMLSGMFLLDPKHSLPLSRLFLRHILRILAALAVWGTAYALVTQVRTAGLSWESVKTALRQVLLGNTHFHLWFLYSGPLCGGPAGRTSTGSSCCASCLPACCPPCCGCGPARR